MAALFDATLEGVQGLLPHRAIDPESEPNKAQVEAWVAEGAARVFARVGSLTVLPDEPIEDLAGLSIRYHARQVARHAAELYAASMTEASGGPELARPNDTTSYATWLLEQYEASVQELILLIDRHAPGEGVPAEAGVGTQVPAYSFPPVTFPDDMRF